MQLCSHACEITFIPRKNVTLLAGKCNSTPIFVTKFMIFPNSIWKSRGYIHTLNWVFVKGGAIGHFEGGARDFWGGAGCFFFFDEVKMKHFVFFRVF